MSFFERNRLRFLRSMLQTEYRVNQGLVHCLTAKEGGKIVAVSIVRAPGYRMLLAPIRNSHFGCNRKRQFELR